MALAGGFRLGQRIVYHVDQGDETPLLLVGTVVGGGDIRITIRLDDFHHLRVVSPSRLKHLT